MNVWSVAADGKTDVAVAVAMEGLSCMRAYMEKMGLAMSLKELGVNSDMPEGIGRGTSIMEGGYKILSPDEILTILKKSMK